MRRMLDPKEAGGSLPSTIEFDKNGNRKVSKDLGVDGKLKLKSLVSSSNPDGDITKELGGGGGVPLYCHSITIKDGISINYYSSKSTRYTFDEFVNEIKDKYLACYGVILSAETIQYVYKIHGSVDVIEASYIEQGSRGKTSINNNSGSFCDSTYLVS